MPEYGINNTTLNLEAIQLKFKNASEWSDDTVLLAGEIGVERDTHKAKIGDGTTTWKNLGYSADPSVQGLVDGLTSRVTTAEGTLTSHGNRLDALDGESGEIAGLKTKDTQHETRMTNIETKDTAQDARLDALDGENGEIAGLKAKDTQHETRMTNIETKDTAQDGRLDALEGITILSANPFRE